MSTVSLCLRSVHFRHHVVIELVIVEKSENESQYDHKCLLQTTYISKPIEAIVRLSIKSVQVQIELIRNRYMYVVKILVWSG